MHLYWYCLLSQVLLLLLKIWVAVLLLLEYLYLSMVDFPQKIMIWPSHQIYYFLTQSAFQMYWVAKSNSDISLLVNLKHNICQCLPLSYPFVSETGHIFFFSRSDLISNKHTISIPTRLILILFTTTKLNT